MENKQEYKPMKWYKSEFVWLLISLVWQVIWAFSINIFNLGDFFIWVLLAGTAYTTYFILKGIIYAWIINPKEWYKKIWKQLIEFITKPFK